MNRYLLAFAIFFSSTEIRAQIVNIENERLLEKKQGWMGSADIGFSFIMNTKQLLQLSDKVKLGYRKNKAYFLALADHAFVKSEGEDFVNSGFQHLRFDYALGDSSRFEWEFFQQGQFNKIQKIDLRLLLGTCLRLNIVGVKNYDLHFGTGVMGEYEELTELGVSRDLLSTSYLSFDGQFTPTFGLNSITYFQPKFIDFGNYRLSNETSLRFKINKYFSLKIVYNLIHDSRNIPGVRKTNYAIKNTLSIAF